MGVSLISPAQLAQENLKLSGYDVVEMRYADPGIKYYMTLPKHCIKDVVIRLSLVSLIMAFFSYHLFLFAIIPCYLIFGMKVCNFTKWCETINWSKKKVWGFFIVEAVLFQLLGGILRHFVILAFSL